MFTLFKKQNAAMMLHQDGNKLVDENGNKVRLLGVNCATLEWTSWPPKELYRSICCACDNWYANIIRLPVAQDRWFGFGRDQEKDPSGEIYRQTVDEMVAAVGHAANMSSSTSTVPTATAGANSSAASMRTTARSFSGRMWHCAITTIRT